MKTSAKRLKSEANSLNKTKPKKKTEKATKKMISRMKVKILEFWVNALDQKFLITGLVEQTRKH